MQQINKFRGIENKLFSYIKEKGQVTRYELRQHFYGFSSGAVNLSLTSLVTRNFLIEKDNKLQIHDRLN